MSAARGNLFPHGTVAAGLVQLDTTAVAVGIAPLALTGSLDVCDPAAPD